MAVPSRRLNSSADRLATTRKHKRDRAPVLESALIELAEQTGRRPLHSRS